MCSCPQRDFPLSIPLLSVRLLARVVDGRRIKELESNLKRTDIQLESFLISQTFRHQLRWPSPSDTTRDANAEDFSQYHILCAKDEPDTYVRTLLDNLTSTPAFTS
jgi:hypothetical protein